MRVELMKKKGLQGETSGFSLCLVQYSEFHAETPAPK
jgi:hypothetical protein